MSDLKPLFRLDGRCVEFPEGLRTAEFAHTIHRFPGKFVPQVAQELIGLIGVQRGAFVADPFCGSGTALVEGALRGIMMAGFDLDPLAILISKVKTSPLSPAQISELRLYWAGRVGEREYDDLASQVPNFHHWFKPGIARQISFLKHKALQLENETLRDFSLVVLSSIIRRVSNADDQTQKTYVSGTLKKTPPEPRELFPLFFARAVQGISVYSARRPVPVMVRQQDARRLSAGRKFDGVLTSPPYIDSIDYVYNQMLEYFWLYDVLGLESPTSIKAFRKEPIGFRRMNPDAGLARINSVDRRAGVLLEPVVRQIQEVSEKEAQNVVGYFNDFLTHLECIKACMKPGAVYALVIGESFIRGAVVPTPRILAALFEALGFEALGSCSYVIKRHYMKFPRRSNSGRIITDHVYCFRRP